MKKIFLIQAVIVLSILFIFTLDFFHNAEAQTCPLCITENIPGLQNVTQALPPPPDLNIEQLRTNLNNAIYQTPIKFNYSPWIDEIYPYPIIDEYIRGILYNIGNTAWEELKCIGLYPETDTLWSIVEIKKQNGYGGHLCGNGNYEYISYWIDWNIDGTYQASEYAGFTSINVHNIDNSLRCGNCQSKSIYYAVSKRIVVPNRRCCYLPHLVKVRAILSYAAPHINPSTIPPYGNVLDKWVQIKPAFCLVELPELYPVDFEPYFTGLIPFDQLPPEITVIQEKEPSPFEIGETSLLAKMREKTCSETCGECIKSKLENLAINKDELKFSYLCKGVEESRFEYKSIVTEFSAGLQYSIDEFINPNYVQLINPEQLTYNNYWLNIFPDLAYLWSTKYEEIKCIGVDTSKNRISAVIHVKLPYGYMGNKCTPGSREYVRFWIDWDCDGFDSNDDIGFTYVNVHDVTTIPSDGLYFAVSRRFRPKYYRSCTDVNVYPARAILSWAVCPDSDPTFKYHWGNMRDCCIQIRPQDAPPGDISPIISTIGGVATGNIDANGYASLYETGWAFCDAPFGGLVSITGYILNVPDFSNDLSCNINFSPDVRYKLQYQKEGWLPNRWEDMEPPYPPFDRFSIQVRKISNTFGQPICEVGNDEGWKKQVNMRDPNGFYSYYEDGDNLIFPRVWHEVVEHIMAPQMHNILMPWDTTRLDLMDFNGDGFPDYNGDGRYFIRMVVKTDSVYKYTVPKSIVIDNTRPYANFTFTNITTCAPVPQGKLIKGIFTALDQHLSHYTLSFDCGVGCGSGDIRTGEYDCDTKDVFETDHTVSSTPYLTLQPAAPPFPTNPTNPSDPTDPNNYFPKPPTLQLLGRNSEPFSWSTASRKPCGYEIELYVWERTIFNNQSTWHRYGHMERHFCITNPNPVLKLTNTKQSVLSTLFGNSGYGIIGGLYGSIYGNINSPMFYNSLPLVFLRTSNSNSPITYNTLYPSNKFNYGVLSNNTSSWNLTRMFYAPFSYYYPYYYGNTSNYRILSSNLPLYWY